MCLCLERREVLALFVEQLRSRRGGRGPGNRPHRHVVKVDLHWGVVRSPSLWVARLPALVAVLEWSRRLRASAATGRRRRQVRWSGAQRHGFGPYPLQRGIGRQCDAACGRPSGFRSLHMARFGSNKRSRFRLRVRAELVQFKLKLGNLKL